MKKFANRISGETSQQCRLRATSTSPLCSSVVQALRSLQRWLSLPQRI